MSLCVSQMEAHLKSVESSKTQALIQEALAKAGPPGGGGAIPAAAPDVPPPAPARAKLPQTGKDKDKALSNKPVPGVHMDNI